MRLFLLKVALICGGVAIGLGLCEGILRVYNPLPFRFKGDKLLLPTHRRYVIKNDKFSKLDPVVIHSKNSLGFRGPEPPRDFADRLTLLAVGGSTTECFNLRDDATWPARLEDRMRGSFRSVWLNNAGYDGTSTYAHLMLAQEYVIRLKPRVVMFYVGINDIGHDDPTGSDAAIQTKDGPAGAVVSIKRYLMWMANWSEVAAVAMNLYRYADATDNRLMRGSQIDLLAVEHGKPFAGKGDSFEQFLAVHERQYMPRYRERLLRLVSLMKENGIQPVLITQPALYGDAIDPPTGVDLGTAILARSLGRDLDGSRAWKLLEGYNDVTRALAGETGTPLIEVARLMPKDSVYFTDAIHYTNQGADKVAEIISGQLCPALQARFGEFKAAPCPGSTVRLSQSESPNELAKSTMSTPGQRF